MASSNMGKVFERQFKLSAEHDSILIIRLNDSDVSFSGGTKTRFAPKNPCDFILFEETKGYLMTLELKSTAYNSLSVQLSPDEEKKMIKWHQIDSLSKFSLHNKVFSGFVLNFRNDDDVKDEDTYYMSIQDFNTCMYETGKKSISKLDVVNYGGIKIKQTLKRTRYLYDVKGLFDILLEKEFLKETDNF